MGQHQRRAEGVGAERGLHLCVVQLPQALFGQAVGAVQHASGVDDAVPRPLGLEVLGGVGNGGLVVQVYRRGGVATQAHGQGAARVGLQVGEEGAADGTGGADDEGAVAVRQ
ncbi:hypothetical protein D3C72_1985760 [compost metagenome]